MKPLTVSTAIIAALILAGALACFVPQGARATLGVLPGLPSGGVPLVGDGDCSGAVNSIDAAMILQYEAGLVDRLACPDSADANLDGITNAVDAALVLQYEAGLVGTLPPPHLLTPTSTPTYAPSTPFPPTPTPT